MKNWKKNMGIALIMVLPTATLSQEKSIEKGNILFNPSITLGWYNYGYSLDAVNIIPPVAFNFEYASSDYFSLGLEAEYGLRRYRDFFFTIGSYEHKYEYKSLSLRGSFHYLDLLKETFSDKLGSLNSMKLDFYIGASTGLLITNITRKWNDGIVSEKHEEKSFDSTWRFGYMAGFRYYFSDHFGTFVETGRNSLGWAKVGLTLKV